MDIESTRGRMTREHRGRGTVGGSLLTDSPPGRLDGPVGKHTLTEAIDTRFGSRQQQVPEGHTADGLSSRPAARDAGMIQRLFGLPDTTATSSHAGGGPDRESEASPSTAGTSAGSRHGSGNLPEALRTEMEGAFLADFSNVRVSDDPDLAASGTLALTEGDHIRFAPGQWAPDTSAGRSLLGHELAHVVQQRQGRGAARGAAGQLAIDASLEAEADVVGSRIASGGQAGLGAVPADERRGAPQPKVGFEVELQVQLSQGGFPPNGMTPFATDEPSSATVPYYTLEEARALPGKPRNALPVETMIAVRSNNPSSNGKIVYLRWNKDTTNGILKPLDIATDEPGRWVKEPDFTEQRSKKPDAYVDPGLNKDEVIHHEAGQYKVVEDHAQQAFGGGQSSLIELVTEPVDEACSLEEFIAPMQEVIAKTKEINKKTNELSNRIPVHTVFPQARRDLYLGVDDPFARGGQSTTAGLQVTFGIQLAAVPELLERKTFGLDADLLISEEARAAAQRFCAIAKLDASSAPNLVGLTHLVFTYLIAGGVKYSGRGGLDKNAIPFLIRHPVSRLRQGSLMEPEQKMLSDREPSPSPSTSTSDSWIDQILEATQRAQHEHLFLARSDSPNVAAWIRAALWGEDDGLLQWGESKEIAPERCGPAENEIMGAVLEERHPVNGIMQVELWEEFATTQWKRFRALNRV